MAYRPQELALAVCENQHGGWVLDFIFPCLRCGASQTGVRVGQVIEVHCDRRDCAEMVRIVATYDAKWSYEPRPFRCPTHAE